MSKTITVMIELPNETLNVAKALINIRMRENPEGNYNLNKFVKDSMDSFSLKVISKSFHVLSEEGDDLLESHI